MTEDSRNHLRGYGSFPEGAEPTDQIAAHDAGDPVSGAPAPIAPTRPGIANQRPAPTAAHPWDSPPSTARFRPGYASDPLDAESTVVPGSEAGGFGSDLADPFFEPESEAAGPRVAPAIAPHPAQESAEPSWMVASRPSVAPAAGAEPSPVRPDGGVSGTYFAPRPASSPDTPVGASRQPDRPSTAVAPPARVSPVEGGTDPWATSSGPHAASPGEPDPATGRWASGAHSEPLAGEDPTGRGAEAGGYPNADRQDATRSGVGRADAGGSAVGGMGVDRAVEDQSGAGWGGTDADVADRRGTGRVDGDESSWADELWTGADSSAGAVWADEDQAIEYRAGADHDETGIDWADGGGESRDWRARGGPSDSDWAHQGQTTAGSAAGFPQDVDPWDPYATQPTSADPAGAESTSASAGATGTGFASWSLASAAPAATSPHATAFADADPAAMGLAATASADADPAAMGPTATASAGAGPAAMGPAAMGPAAMGPAAMGPAAMGPAAMGPAAAAFADAGPAAMGPAARASTDPGLVAIGPAATASAATAPMDAAYPGTRDPGFANAPFSSTAPASARPMADGPIYEPPDRTAAPAPATRNTGDPAGGQPGGDPDDGDPYGYAPLPGGWSPPAGRNRPAGDPYGLPAASAPRIEPSQPPRRTRLLTGTLIGLVIGLLLFGTAGWFAGRVTAPAASPRPQSTRASTANGLGVFEQSQVALNKPDFNGTKLAPIAQGWLPYLSTCGRSGNPGGPRLANGEKTRVRCTLDGMSALFVEYKSTADRDRALARTRDQSADARKLTPGVARPTEKATPSGRTSGSYVEFAYELTEGGVTRTVAGVWWDDAQTPIAAYLLAYWKDGLGERWEPVRDLWSRYA